MALILVREGPLTGRRYEIEEAITLGRSDADLTIDDLELSRQHVLLRLEDGAHVVEDLGSLNGTWVNGTRIPTPTRVAPGDLFRLGMTVIEVLGAEAVVEGRDVAKVYGSGETTVHALRGVSIAIERGKLTAIMGPSGSGKSTLMHILAGLDRPTSGTVLIDEIEITELSETELTMFRRDRIGFIFQFFNLMPTLNAEENILLPLSIAGKSDDAYLEELLDRVGLTERRKHRPAEMSGGQQQRLAVARALITKPAVIFADEPTGNLDSETGGEILALLREAVDYFGQTTVMVTHDPRAAKFADRTLFLADGLIAVDRGAATTREVLLALEEVAHK